MKRLARLFLVVSMLVAGAGCWSYREYVIENDRLGAKGFYHKCKLSYDLDKFNDDIGPKHVYYYE